MVTLSHRSVYRNDFTALSTSPLMLSVSFIAPPIAPPPAPPVTASRHHIFGRKPSTINILRPDPAVSRPPAALRRGTNRCRSTSDAPRTPDRQPESLHASVDSRHRPGAIGNVRRLYALGHDDRAQSGSSRWPSMALLLDFNGLPARGGCCI